MIAEPVRNPQDNATLAWNCGAYVFGVSDSGHVTLDTGDTGWDEPAQKAQVFINGVWQKTVDVPATTKNKHYDLGDVSVPATGGFDWEVKGVDDCGNKGHADGQQEQKNAAWPEISSDCVSKKYDVTIHVTNGVANEPTTAHGDLSGNSKDFDFTVTFKSGQPSSLTFSIHIPSLIEAGCGAEGTNAASYTVKYDCEQNVAAIQVNTTDGGSVEPDDHLTVALKEDKQVFEFHVSFETGEPKSIDLKTVVWGIKKACSEKIEIEVAGGKICIFTWHDIPKNTKLWGNWTTGPNGSEGRAFNGWILVDNEGHLIISTNKGEDNKGWLVISEGSKKWYVYVENNKVYDFDLDNHGCFVWKPDATTFDQGSLGSDSVVSSKVIFQIPEWHFSEILKEATVNGGIFSQTGGMVLVNGHIVVAHESQFPSIKELKVGMKVVVGDHEFVIKSAQLLDKMLAGIYAANTTDTILITCNEGWTANIVFTFEPVESDLMKYVM